MSFIKVVVELVCISQYPLPEITTSYTTSRIPMRVFQKRLFVLENMQIEEHVNSKGKVINKYTTCKYDSEYYKLKIPYKKLKEEYFTQLVIKGYGNA
jgi:hypothetical protein